MLLILQLALSERMHNHQKKKATIGFTTVTIHNYSTLLAHVITADFILSLSKEVWTITCPKWFIIRVRLYCEWVWPYVISTSDPPTFRIWIKERKRKKKKTTKSIYKIIQICKSVVWWGETIVRLHLNIGQNHKLYLNKILVLKPWFEWKWKRKVTLVCKLEYNSVFYGTIKSNCLQAFVDAEENDMSQSNFIKYTYITLRKIILSDWRKKNTSGREDIFEWYNITCLARN